MEYGNDGSIFDYLRMNDNNILSDINMCDLNEILSYLDKYYLEYRNNIGVSSDITFGSEIEFEHFKGTVYDHWPFQLKINDIIGNDSWVVVNDISLNFGREIVSDILIDDIDTWNKIRDVCKLSK